MAAAAGAAPWTWAPSHSALSSKRLNLRPALVVPAIPRGGRWRLPQLSIRNNATSQDKTVGTQSSKTPSDSVEEQEEVSEAATATGGEDEVSIVPSRDTTGAQPQRQQQEIAEALKELRKQGASSKTENFWTGLAEEIGLIEWPSFSKVFGTTLVVLGIILGSSFVLLTVNFLLAELSDIVFKIQ